MEDNCASVFLYGNCMEAPSDLVLAVRTAASASSSHDTCSVLVLWEVCCEGCAPSRVSREATLLTPVRSLAGDEAAP